MVLDSSAIVAILFEEPEGLAFEAAMTAANTRLVSAVTRVEAALVIEGRKGITGREMLERFWRVAEVETVPVTLAQAELAIEAFRRFGKGRHKAALNLGDCFAYALAKATFEKLLFKGDDFALTDIVSAL